MLIALLIGAIAALLIAGGGADMFSSMLRYWRRALRRHVDDRARREAGEAKLDEFEREAALMVGTLQEWMLGFARVHRRHESTLADYERLADALVEEVYIAQVQLIDIAEELRQTIGDRAWTEITEDVEDDLRAARAKQDRKRAKQAEPRVRTRCRE